METYKGKSVLEVLSLLDEYKGDSKIIAGGTDIVIELRHDDNYPKALIDISSIKELSEIKEDEGIIEIGASATFTNVVNNTVLGSRLKGLKDAANSVGSPQIRNKGTVGGNIANGSPAADTVPPLLALDGVLVIKSKNNTREVPLEKIFLDKGKVDLKEDELLYSIKFKNLKENEGLGFSKLGLRKALAISRICTSIYIKVDGNNVCSEMRIGNGALGRHGLREREVEEFMVGKVLNEENINEGANLMAEVIKKRLDGRSSMEFKSEAVKGTFKKAVYNALENCK